MKLYISADIEGVAGVTSWSETDLNNRESTSFIMQMEKEVLKICECAKQKGFNEIVVKDAHETGRNIDFNVLPDYVRLIRGWSGHPLAMLEGIDESYDAIALVGFHSAASRETSPLSHTMHVRKVNYIKINGKIASEFLIFYYAGLNMGIPTIFVSGDEGLCSEIKEVNNGIVTVSTKTGFGRATMNIHPNQVINELENKFNSIEFEKAKYLKPLPNKFTVEVAFKNPATAYWASFYPGVVEQKDNKILFESYNYMDVLKLFSFVIS
ncbi:MAG: M55 family metallopeptidase [Eubacteriales bacterium]